MAEDDVKYIFDTKSLTDWQKLFNQWKHKYTIEILDSNEAVKLADSSDVIRYHKTMLIRKTLK